MTDHSPAGVAGRSEKTYSPEQDARSFVEDLIQLDRISHESAQGALPAERTAPGPATPCEKTSYLVREDAKVVLKRRHFACGFRGCQTSR